MCMGGSAHVLQSHLILGVHMAWLLRRTGSVRDKVEVETADGSSCQAFNGSGGGLVKKGQEQTDTSGIGRAGLIASGCVQAGAGERR